MSSARGEIEGEKEGLGAEAAERFEKLDFEVRHATRPMPPMFESSWSVEQLQYQGLPANPMTSMPVARQGELIGFLLRRDLDFVPPEHAAQTSLGELMNPDSLRVISAYEPVHEALKSMDQYKVNQLVVMDGDYVTGIVTREDILRAMLNVRRQDDSENLPNAEDRSRSEDPRDSL